MNQVRPPIVTILGHVDHGKTTLLDFIRKSSIAKGEHGGITQHIGAYQVEIPKESKSRESEANQGILRLPTVAQDDFAENRKITFIDTPGHAAFEKMRSRGAQVADIAVLVVALDDGLMPQTLEAIKHIKQAKVPMIVAINKIDLPGIDKKVQLQKIKKQLSDSEVLIEEYGGDVLLVELSAKTGEGVDKLLESILLVAEMSEIKGDLQESPAGVVIESSLDKFKGPIATILIRNGSIKKGDQLIVSGIKARVRGMFDYNGKPLESAEPSTPVEVLGLEKVPPVGATLGEDLAETKEKQAVQTLLGKLSEGANKTLKVIIKADKAGSLEAIEASLNKFSTKGGSASGGNEESKVVDFIQTGTGDINEDNIKLAFAVGAIVIGFNVKIAPAASKLAETEGVLVRNYNIIYELIEEMEEVVEGLLKVGAVEEIFGRAEIIAEFPYGKNEKIAGCRVLEGLIAKGQRIRIIRGEEKIGETKLKSLKKVKDEVNKVEKGNDCGMMFEPALDFAVGDFVESFRTI